MRKSRSGVTNSLRPGRIFGAGLLAFVAVIASDKIHAPLIVCKVFDRVTAGKEGHPAVVCGVEIRNGTPTAIPDWVLL